MEFDMKQAPGIQVGLTIQIRTDGDESHITMTQKQVEEVPSRYL